MPHKNRETEHEMFLKWTKCKNWEFGLIQKLVNDLTTVYGMSPKKCSSEKDLYKRGMACGEEFGHFQKNTSTLNQRNPELAIKAQMEKWVPKWMRPTYVWCLGNLYGLLSCTLVGTEDLGEHYKKAKSNILNSNSYSPPEKEALLRVINKLVV